MAVGILAAAAEGELDLSSERRCVLLRARAGMCCGQVEISLSCVKTAEAGCCSNNMKSFPYLSCCDVSNTGPGALFSRRSAAPVGVCKSKKTFQCMNFTAGKDLLNRGSASIAVSLLCGLKNAMIRNSNLGRYYYLFQPFILTFRGTESHQRTN